MELVIPSRGWTPAAWEERKMMDCVIDHAAEPVGDLAFPTVLFPARYKAEQFDGASITHADLSRRTSTRPLSIVQRVPGRR